MGSTLYETDVSAWLGQQGGLLRRGDLAALDVQNLGKEIESSGGGQRRERGSRIRVPVMHLVKWHMQPDERGRSTGRDGAPALVGLA